MKRALLTAALVAFASTAHAATIVNFDSHAAGNQISGTPPPSTVVTNDYATLGIVFGEAGFSAGVAVVNDPSDANSPPNAVCGLNAAGNIPDICTGDTYFHFVNPANGVSAASTNFVSFVLGDSGGDTDSYLLHVYNSSNVELEARPVVSLARTLQSFLYPDIARVWIQWTDGPFGYLVDDVTFNEPASTAAVPEPASLTLLAGGLGLIARRMRRRKQVD